MIINLISSPFFASFPFHQHHKVFFILIFIFPKKNNNNNNNILIGWEIIQHFKRISDRGIWSIFLFSPTKSPLWNFWIWISIIILCLNNYFSVSHIIDLKLLVAIKKKCAPIIDGKEPQFTGEGEKINKLFRAPQPTTAAY